MTDDVQIFRSLIEDYIEGRLDLDQFTGSFIAARRRELGYLGEADGPIMEVIGLLNVYGPDRDDGRLKLDAGLRQQYQNLARIGPVHALRADSSDQVVEYLVSDDPEIRVWAAERASAVDPSAPLLARLRALLRDQDHRVARVAADTLAGKGDVASLRSIAKLLSHDLERRYRLELWAVYQLAMLAGQAERNFAIEAIDNYIQAGGAALPQANEYLETLRRKADLS